jgi:hypothetical protein
MILKCHGSLESCTRTRTSCERSVLKTSPLNKAASYAVYTAYAIDTLHLLAHWSSPQNWLPFGLKITTSQHVTFYPTFHYTTIPGFHIPMQIVANSSHKFTWSLALCCISWAVAIVMVPVSTTAADGCNSRWEHQLGPDERAVDTPAKETYCSLRRMTTVRNSTTDL